MEEGLRLGRHRDLSQPLPIGFQFLTNAAITIGRPMRMGIPLRVGTFARDWWLNRVPICAPEPRRVNVLTELPWGGTRSVGLGNPEHLARKNQIGVVDPVPVRVVDERILKARSISGAGDTP